jgi:superfamily II DNA helicase RecQ
MIDQVDGLKARGVAAAQLDSSLSIQETMMAKNGIKDKTLKILYVAPERLNNELFIEMIRDHTISLLAVDEAHSIDAWGPSFRAGKLSSSCASVQ